MCHAYIKKQCYERVKGIGHLLLQKVLDYENSHCWGKTGLLAVTMHLPRMTKALRCRAFDCGKRGAGLPIIFLSDLIRGIPR